MLKNIGPTLKTKTCTASVRNCATQWSHAFHEVVVLSTNPFYKGTPQFFQITYFLHLCSSSAIGITSGVGILLITEEMNLVCYKYQNVLYCHSYVLRQQTELNTKYVKLFLCATVLIGMSGYPFWTQMQHFTEIFY